MGFGRGLEWETRSGGWGLRKEEDEKSLFLLLEMKKEEGFTEFAVKESMIVCLCEEGRKWRTMEFCALSVRYFWR